MNTDRRQIQRRALGTCLVLAAVVAALLAALAVPASGREPIPGLSVTETGSNTIGGVKVLWTNGTLLIYYAISDPSQAVHKAYVDAAVAGLTSVTLSNNSYAIFYQVTTGVWAVSNLYANSAGVAGTATNWVGSNGLWTAVVTLVGGATNTANLYANGVLVATNTPSAGQIPYFGGTDGAMYAGAAPSGADMSWTNGAATTTTSAGAVFTNGLLMAYSPLLYSGGNTGLFHDGSTNGWSFGGSTPTLAAVLAVGNVSGASDILLSSNGISTGSQSLLFERDVAGSLYTNRLVSEPAAGAPQWLTHTATGVQSGSVLFATNVWAAQSAGAGSNYVFRWTTDGINPSGIGWFGPELRATSTNLYDYTLTNIASAVSITLPSSIKIFDVVYYGNSTGLAAGASATLRLNNDSSALYDKAQIEYGSSATPAASVGDTSITGPVFVPTSTGHWASATLKIMDNGTTKHVLSQRLYSSGAATALTGGQNNSALYRSSALLTNILITCPTGHAWTNGTRFVVVGYLR